MSDLDALTADELVALHVKTAEAAGRLFARCTEITALERAVPVSDEGTYQQLCKDWRIAYAAAREQEALAKEVSAELTRRREELSHG